jgi:hypothetical protein
MKLLVSELGAWSRYVSREFFHTMNALIADHEWKHIEAHCLHGQPGKVESILLDRFGELPSVILFWEAYHVFPTIFTDLRALRCRKCVFTDDLHSFDDVSRAIKELTLTYSDTIISTYAYRLHDYFPDLRGLRKKIVWSPHAASPEFLLPFNQHPEDLVLLSGNLNDCYPIRQQVKALHDRGGIPIAHQPHPGYGCHHDYSGDSAIGRNFAAAIQEYRAALADPPYRYLVAKYFEIPATGALLLAGTEVSRELGLLGFEENVHYLGVSRADVEQKIRYAVSPDNHAEVDAIRKRGQELVWERHTTAHRAQTIDEAC